MHTPHQYNHTMPVSLTPHIFICPMDSRSLNVSYLREPLKITHTLCTHLPFPPRMQTHLAWGMSSANKRRRRRSRVSGMCGIAICIIYIGFEFVVFRRSTRVRGDLCVCVYFRCGSPVKTFRFIYIWCAKFSG